MPRGTSTRSAVLLTIFAVSVSLFLIADSTARADQQPLVRSTIIQMNVGDSLFVQCDQLAIQRIFLEGNLSSVNIQKPVEYPAANLELNASEPDTFEVEVMFSRNSDYSVNLYVMQAAKGLMENTTAYYVSGGSFELDITAYVNPKVEAALPATTSTWGGFSSWMGSFGEAFPLWVKVLYFILGFQFLAVGGLWIRRETARKETATQAMDSGEKAYLWLDVAYKFLLTSFVAIVAIMGGELLFLFVLRFMFLVSLNLLSLWDLFVVGFAAGAVILVYLVRFTCEKAFDLKPVEEA